MDATKITEKIFNRDNFSFENVALEIFNYQFQHNPVYRRYVQLIGTEPAAVTSLPAIPFLPAGFFKTHRVLADNCQPELVFESSGTTGEQPALHYVADAALYQKSFLEGFQRFYGDPSDWNILALLPSYLERGNSSLVYMFAELIRRSGSPLSGFYLGDPEKLNQALTASKAASRKTMLLGVTYALLDLAERSPQDLRHAVIMETGGMKGRREELVREVVHNRLKQAFQAKAIHSEYGMTELLSQAWSAGDGLFRTPPWMKVLRREINDAFAVYDSPGRGIINIIDLANVHSCAFLATQDIGQLHEQDCFEVLGRTDNSDLRGCNLLLTS